MGARAAAGKVMFNSQSNVVNPKGLAVFAVITNANSECHGMEAVDLLRRQLIWLT
jgi:hypothetical protein